MQHKDWQDGRPPCQPTKAWSRHAVLISCARPVHSLTSGLSQAREHLHPTESSQTEKVSFAFFAESSPSSLSLRLQSSILSESLQKHYHGLKHTIICSRSPFTSLLSLRIWGHQHVPLKPSTTIKSSRYADEISSVGAQNVFGERRCIDASGGNTGNGD